MQSFRHPKFPYLFLVVIFGAGAVLMALEILALRIIAKNFGSALREVSAVIAVFLGAMSAGYALGGRVGDRRPVPSTLTSVLVLGGLVTLLIPLIEKPVASAVFDSALPLGMHAAVVSIALFALPACFIGSVTPIATRLRMRSVEQSGSVAGAVSAMSTVGSIVGTIGAGYVLISYLQVSRGILLLGVTLCGLGLLALRGPGVLGCIVVTALLWPVRASSEPPGVVFERDTSYHHIIIRERAGKRTLHFDSSIQGRMSIEDPMKGALPYTYYVHNAFVIAPTISSVLVIGLGSASIPRQLLHYYPNVNVTVAEVDPVVVEVAKKYFSLPEDPRLTIETVDGRVFVKRTPKQFDVIMLDAFAGSRYGITLPPHLTTREFLAEVKQRLTPEGVLIYNSPGSINNRITKALYKTIAEVFPEQYVFRLIKTNTIIMAVVNPRKLSRDDLVARGRAALKSGLIKRPSQPDRLGHLDTSLGDPSKLQEPVLTDDYAPVNRLRQ